MVLLPALGVGAVLLQPELPLLLYSIVAPVSTPLRVIAPLLVILSVPLAPVSAVNAAVGAAALVSSVKLSALDAALVLPATSIWRT